MARLSYGAREEMPERDFALPSKREGGKGGYPIPDASHARNALARVSEFGNSAQKAEVRAKVHAKFPGIGQSPGGYVPNPQMNKPHMHALSMAAATHLQRMGHISPSQSAAIHARSRQAMVAPGMSAPTAAPAAAFGSLAPPMNETV